MNKETYFNAQSALKYKFVDEIMFDEELKLVANIKGGILPQEAINKLRSHLKQQINSDNKKDEIEKAQIKLNFLKLKGVKSYEF